ncbi:MAG: 16S rRNA (guanine(966)-N(2))-methyltransferase RsmD [Proteobacteria bacterium]|nr:16S rRNA (guanine(966)-N(2))-methyltransferase RsmD [Pseudomonadota bacterium]MBU1709314.1 16S rRNA (guanine(966)-N(2))-methyltransferase RsmD [Pseudomonadota bacterium]
MRIIAGTARGRKLSSPAKALGQLIRPTADRAREAIFSVIGTEIKEGQVLDLFAGTGAFGLEALSRGAAGAVFVDQHRAAVELVYGNIQKCGFSDRSVLLNRDLSKSLFFLKQYAPPGGFTLVFIDPPYRTNLWQGVIEQISGLDILNDNVLIIVEDDSSAALPDSPGKFDLSDKRRYGDTGFWLYRRGGNNP